jgi:hypothetical protein
MGAFAKMQGTIKRKERKEAGFIHLWFLRRAVIVKPHPREIVLPWRRLTRTLVA